MTDWRRYGDTCEQAYDHLHGLHEERIRQVDALYAQNKALIRMLQAASDALKSYAYGNSATDLAEEIAKACDEALAKAGAEP